MPTATRKLAALLLVFLIVGIAGAALWFGLRLRAAPSGPAQPRACAEWQGAEFAKQSLGWDLGYEPLLRKSGVCPGDPFCEMVEKKPRPPVIKYLSEWQGAPLLSSILIELPDGHADMMAIWAVRTKDEAYVLGFYPVQSDSVRKQAVPAQDYDRVFETMACWRQEQPAKREFGEKGYIGFLNLYKDGQARQLLLTYNDLYEGNTGPDERRPGRFFKALEPLRPYW